jgi:DNA adenine methylase
MKPLVKWSGGKSDELANITPHIPKTFLLYLEPFIGGGALYFHLQPENAIVSDVHKELVDLYQSIKDGLANEIHTFMENHPNNEETYYKVRSIKPQSQLENAKRFFYLRKTCFRGMLRYNKKGEFNIPFGRYKTCNYNELKNEKYQELLGRTSIHCKDFSYIFENHNDENNFMFLDPPYDSEFTDYGYCTFGKEEHIRLATEFKKTKIKCLMVIGNTPFIQSLYSKYIVAQYEKKYRFKLHSGRVGDEINTIHLIIKNYK